MTTAKKSHTQSHLEFRLVLTWRPSSRSQWKTLRKHQTKPKLSLKDLITRGCAQAQAGRTCCRPSRAPRICDFRAKEFAIPLTGKWTFLLCLDTPCAGVAQVWAGNAKPPAV